MTRDEQLAILASVIEAASELEMKAIAAKAALLANNQTDYLDSLSIMEEDARIIEVHVEDLVNDD